MQYIKIDVKINDKKSTKVPYYLGAMLRGAFGYALKRVTCINPSFKCEGCFAQNSCLYYDFYEKANIPHKYRLDINLGSKKFDFSFYLFDEVIQKTPYILSALEMTLKTYGIGKDRIKFEDFEILLNGKTVYKNSEFANVKIEPKTIEIGEYYENVRVKLLTPLRSKKDNKLERKELNPRDLIRSIDFRKKQIFDNITEHKLSFEPSYITYAKALNHTMLYRKSYRQQKKLIIDGVVGEISIIGLDKESFKLLKIGEIIGAGKQTNFGLGKIKVEKLG